MVNLNIKWNDPQLAVKAKQFFLDLYHEKRAEQIVKNTARAKCAEGGGENGTAFSLGADNLPEEILEEPQFTRLMSVLTRARTTFEAPMPETADARTAALILIRRSMLGIVFRLIQNRLLAFLMLDSRFNPTNPIQIDAIDAFIFTDDATNEHDCTQFESLLGCAALYNFIWRPHPLNADFADELLTLQTVWDTFFDMAQSLFPIQAVTKCRRAFTLLIADFGKANGRDQVANFIRRRKTMSREILEWRRNGGQITSEQIKCTVDAVKASVDANTKAIADNTKIVANMDRRQKTFLGYLKKVINGFVKLFPPAVKPPTREQVIPKLSLADRYACVANFPEPRKSQLMAVIDHTLKKPVVYGEAKRKGVYTLANAAKDVWDANHEKWERISGSYQTYEQLKSACYNLSEKDNDPFCYQA